MPMWVNGLVHQFALAGFSESFLGKRYAALLK